MRRPAWVFPAPAARVSGGCKPGLRMTRQRSWRPPAGANDTGAEHACWHVPGYPNPITDSALLCIAAPTACTALGVLVRGMPAVLATPLKGTAPACTDKPAAGFRRCRRGPPLRRGRPRARRACGAAPTPSARPQVGEALAQLAEVVGAFEEALDPADARRGEAELAPVLAGALEPLLEMCERSAEALSVDHPARRGAWGRVPMPRLRSPGARAAAPGPATHTRRRAGPPGAPTARRRAAPAPARPRARRARAGAPGGAAAPRAGWTRRARSTRPRSAST